MELVRVLRRKVHSLAEILFDVVELPFVTVDHVSAAGQETQGAEVGVVAATQPS